MRALVLLALAAAAAAEPVVLRLPAHGEQRRYVVARWNVPRGMKGPFLLREAASGRTVACQWEREDNQTVLRCLVRDVKVGRERVFHLDRGGRGRERQMSIAENLGGWYSIHSPEREITRLHYGALGLKFKKPFFFPLNGHGVDVLRGYPMAPREGDARDHPHHTGLYFTHGDVNGQDFWHKKTIRHVRVQRSFAGPVYARLTSENQWGDELVESQDVLVYDVGPDVLMDWTITLTAAKKPVTFGKTKEGSFALRVGPGLSGKGVTIVDANGNRGEPAIRGDNAPWVDYSGTVGGKRVGVAVMNHPRSFRAPTHWQVREYGLFAANPFRIVGAHRLEKGESVVFRYRVYVHAGDAVEGKVAAVFAGYAR